MSEFLGTLQFVDLETGIWKLVCEDTTHTLNFSSDVPDPSLINTAVTVTGTLVDSFGISMDGDSVLSVATIAPR